MRLLFLVNGGPGSAMGIRARSFAERLSDEFEIAIIYRSANKFQAILGNVAGLLRSRPALCWVFDMGFSGVLAAGFYRMISRCRVVIDTGDAIYELARSTGSRGRIGLWLTKQLEDYALSIGDGLVVRSHPHQELLAERGIQSDAIPDGVDLNQFQPRDQFQPRAQEELRGVLGLDGALVVGILGSLIWNQRSGTCYGAEVIEVIHRLSSRSVKGLVIGDGTGLDKLKEQCAALGIQDRMVFTGRVAYDDLPRYLNLMDVCISTQSNDPVGQVRTSGKLPLYLACGRFVLATDVGEAARVLPREMLVSYHGADDPDYPARLEERLNELLDQPGRLRQPAASVAIARQHFDYDDLAARVGRTVRRVLKQAGEVSPVKMRARL
jgi:glycosyltransferase involved in cell wall biosynthesis